MCKRAWPRTAPVASCAFSNPSPDPSPSSSPSPSPSPHQAIRYTNRLRGDDEFARREQEKALRKAGPDGEGRLSCYLTNYSLALAQTLTLTLNLNLTLTLTLTPTLPRPAARLLRLSVQHAPG